MGFIASLHSRGDVVARDKIDLLVAATHGRTGFAGVLQGSVAEELFRNVRCPALVLGPEVNPQPSSKFKLSRILLGVHHPEPARIVSHLALDIAAGIVAQSECPVLTVRDN